MSYHPSQNGEACHACHTTNNACSCQECCHHTKKDMPVAPQLPSFSLMKPNCSSVAKDTVVAAGTMPTDHTRSINSTPTSTLAARTSFHLRMPSHQQTQSTRQCNSPMSTVTQTLCLNYSHCPDVAVQGWKMSMSVVFLLQLLV
jgi:hypothetical protein